LAWSIAVISLVLPWMGLGLCLAGVVRVINGTPFGWWLLLSGAIMIAADLVIDFVWAHPSVSKSDEPDLNRRGAQCIGRICMVEEAIAGNRGKVRIGDTVWPAEGQDAPVGTPVRVLDANGTVLIVEPVR
jgi:membrane protein implicated in regulation of membrane protease activity